jgi:hypothetical protein
VEEEKQKEVNRAQSAEKHEEIVTLGEEQVKRWADAVSGILFLVLFLSIVKLNVN